MTTVSVEVSNRHVHVSQADLEILFGPGATLHTRRAISQTGQYAAEESVTLVGPKSSLERVRIVGPVRAQTQVELSRTDTDLLGLEAPLRDSGQLAGSAGIKLVGPTGEVELHEGVIRQRRHIHASPNDCATHGVTPGSSVRVKVNGYTFDDVLIKVDPSYVWRFHIDTNEALLAHVRGSEIGEVLT